jgi:hypothetical protein
LKNPIKQPKKSDNFPTSLVAEALTNKFKNPTLETKATKEKKKGHQIRNTMFTSLHAKQTTRCMLDRA